MTEERAAGKKGIGPWFDRWGPRLGWAIVGLLIGLAVGWWFGGWVGCSRSEYGCTFRADSAEAAGTWFGAIGTVAAVLTAVAAFRSDERSRERQAGERARRQREDERRIWKEASAVTIGVGVTVTFGDGAMGGYAVTVKNGADTTPVFRLRGEDPRGPLTEQHTIDAGGVATTERRERWTPPVPLGEFEAWAMPQTKIRFTMNGRSWTRTGNGPVEPIERDDYV